MTRQTVGTVLVSGAVGFGLGALVFRAPATSPSAAPQPGAATTPAPIVKVVERERIVTVPGAAPPVPPVASTPTPTATDPASTAALSTLESKVASLERQLAIEKQLRIGTEGERVEPPKDLDKRFRDEKQLLETFNAAFKAAGFTDAQVESIDCTEHPCIVYGRGFGERHDLERLKPFLGAYQKDEFSTFGFVNGEGASAKRFFGVGVMPQDSDRDDALHKRLNHRVQQMYEVSKPAR